MEKESDGERRDNNTGGLRRLMHGWCPVGLVHQLIADKAMADVQRKMIAKSIRFGEALRPDVDILRWFKRSFADACNRMVTAPGGFCRG